MQRRINAPADENGGTRRTSTTLVPSDESRSIVQRNSTISGRYDAVVLHTLGSRLD